MGEEKNSPIIHFYWYDWILSIITFGIYVILKFQKINFEFQELNKKVKNISEVYEKEINNKINLYEQKFKYLEHQKHEKDKRIYELKNDLEKRSEQITKLLKDKDDQLSRFLKEKDEQIKLKNEEIHKLNNENGNLKNNNKVLDIEKEKIIGRLNESNTKNESYTKQITELEKQLAIEKNNNTNSQLINTNPYSCSKNLTDHVIRVYEGAFGSLQKYSKLEKEKNIQSDNSKSKRADFLLTFYKNIHEKNKDPVENFRVVIECKNHDLDNNKDKVIDNKYLLQLIEYSRLFNAKYAILLTSLKLNKDWEDLPFSCLNDWSKLHGKGIFKNPTDAEIFIVKPEYFELFLKMFQFFNESTNISATKFDKINRVIDIKTLWEFVKLIKQEIVGISELKQHIKFIEDSNKTITNTSEKIRKRIQSKILPSIDQISSNLYEKTDDIELALPQENKKLSTITEKSIKEVISVEVEKNN